MDILKMLAEIRAEREHIDEAILVLERLAAGMGSNRRGRPPKWMSAASAKVATASAPDTEKKRVMSAAGRRRMAEAQKKRWAKRKAEAAQTAS
jgi:hypothetical protein